MLRRIYIDTSVIGGCLDAEFSQPSLALMELFRSGRAIAVISDLTELELQRSPAAVMSVLTKLSTSAREMVQFDAEAGALAQRYLDAGVVSAKYTVDAQHIALATVQQVQVLVSWNFRHIVNLERVRGYNSVNLRWGYPLLEIRSPREVITYDEEGV
jgi:predicted thioesterase